MPRRIADGVKADAARMLDRGGMTQREIAAQLGISQSSVSRINQSRDTWLGSSSGSSMSVARPVATSSRSTYSPEPCFIPFSPCVPIQSDNSQQLRNELAAKQNIIQQLNEKMDVLVQQIKAKDRTIEELLTANESNADYEEIKKENEELKKRSAKLDEENKELKNECLLLKERKVWFEKDNQKLHKESERMEKKLDDREEQLKTLLGKLLELCAKYD